MPTGMKTQLERYLNMFNLNQNKKKRFQIVMTVYFVSIGFQLVIDL